MKRALCAILFATLIPSSSQAGFVGQVGLSTGSAANGSLAVNSSHELVGTNLLAPTATPASGSPVYALGGYLSFNTGALISSDAQGNATYAAANGNFFVLPTLVGSNPPALAASIQTSIATVTATGTYDTIGGFQFQIFDLTMGFTGGYVSQTLSTDFGLPYTANRIYAGTLSFSFINDEAQGGNQLLSGSVAFTVPEPSSLAMLGVGGVSLLGLGRRRLKKPGS